MRLDFAVFGCVLGFIVAMGVSIALHFVWRVFSADSDDGDFL